MNTNYLQVAVVSTNENCKAASNQYVHYSLKQKTVFWILECTKTKKCLQSDQ